MLNRSQAMSVMPITYASDPLLGVAPRFFRTSTFLLNRLFRPFPRRHASRSTRPSRRNRTSCRSEIACIFNRIR